MPTPSRYGSPNTQGNEKNQQPYDSGLLGPVSLQPSVTLPATLEPTAVSTTTATAAMDADGRGADVSLTVVNAGTSPVTGVVTATGPDGWTAARSAPLTVPPGRSVAGATRVFPGGFVPDGDVEVRVAFEVGGTVVDDAMATLDASFATPPARSTDHVDLGDAASESAHGLTASPTSGTNVEAGLTRRYGGYRIPDAWYEFDLAVTAGKGFVLQGLETYDANPQQKSYRVFVDGELVATRLNVRPLRQEGTAGYRLFVPAEHVGSDSVRVRLQSRSDPDFADPSLADVWALPFDGDAIAPVAAPRVTGPARVGATLRATAGSWNLGGLTFAYRWLRNGAPISGATGSSYRPGAADVGKRLTVRVTATKAGKAPASATSTATARVTKVPSRTKVVVNKVRVKKGKPVRVTATVVSSLTAAGKVAVRVDGKVVKRVTLRRGKAVATVRMTTKGKHRITVTYAGSSLVAASISARRIVRVA